MTRAAKLIPALLVALPLALACGATEAPAPSAVAVSDEVSPSEAAPVAKDGVPKIASDAAIHEFGAIKATDSVEHVFKIRNAGTADLEIERVERT